MGLLNDLLIKRKLDSVEHLSEEEKATFEQWQSILNKEELNVEDIKNFCRSQIDVIEGKWADLNTSQAKKSELIPYHTVYSLLLKVIDSPKSAKEALEKNLIQLINAD